MDSAASIQWMANIVGGYQAFDTVPVLQSLEHHPYAQYDTTSTSTVDVDATNLSLNFYATGEPMQLGIDFGAQTSANTIYAYYYMRIDGKDVPPIRLYSATGGALIVPLSFNLVANGVGSSVVLAPGMHNMKLGYKVTSGGTASVRNQYVFMYARRCF